MARASVVVEMTWMCLHLIRVSLPSHQLHMSSSVSMRLFAPLFEVVPECPREQAVLFTSRRLIYQAGKPFLFSTAVDKLFSLFLFQVTDHNTTEEGLQIIFIINPSVDVNTFIWLILANKPKMFSF